MTKQPATVRLKRSKGLKLRETRRRGGAAATELALTLPVLLLIVFGCVDFGRSIAVYSNLSNAARVGAEYGATHQFTPHTFESWKEQVGNAAIEEMANVHDFEPDELSLEITTDPDTNDSVRVTVKASYPFKCVTTWPGIPADILLNRQVSMRQFR